MSYFCESDDISFNEDNAGIEVYDDIILNFNQKSNKTVPYIVYVLSHDIDIKQSKYILKFGYDNYDEKYGNEFYIYRVYAKNHNHAMNIFLKIPRVEKYIDYIKKEYNIKEINDIFRIDQWNALICGVIPDPKYK
uniref:Uncharacterized protein n=1 Tax=viral metagenome TaxID=1070528 RepID=A0A6C0ACV0_9ZZZZ